MLYVTILKNNKEQNITLNQKQICSFHDIEIIQNKQTIKATEVRMSNGDIWIVIQPPFEDWHIDAFITSSEY